MQLSGLLFLSILEAGASAFAADGLRSISPLKKSLRLQIIYSMIPTKGNSSDSEPSQMATLNDMLLAELIKIGDTIEFTFKGQHLYGENIERRSYRKVPAADPPRGRKRRPHQHGGL